MSLKIIEIASAYPPAILTNSDLESEFLKYNPDAAAEVSRVVSKIQIFARHVAPRSLTALDLTVTAAQRLRDTVPKEFADVDYVIHCTQSPEYILPTSACLLHARLNLREDVGAIDVNLGCSGYVYCLSLADSLLAAGHARTILITTADTYTHYLHPRDITNRLIFGDAAAATLVVRDESSPPSKFIHWTDGGSANHLILQNGGSRNPATPTSGGNPESFTPPDPSCLHMNGYEVFKFGITKVPALLDRYLTKYQRDLSSYDWLVPHQANGYMLDELNKRIKFPSERLVRYFESIGNTVSASIPLAIEAYRRQGKIQCGSNLLLAGFGVGFSAAIGDVRL